MKKYFLGFLALSMAVASVAFTDKKPVKAFNPMWYYKEDTSNNEGDRTKYEALVSQDGLCQGTGSVRCVIEAPAHLTGGNPDGTPDLSGSVIVHSFKP